MIGQKFNKWMIIEEIGRGEHGKLLYKAICECGTIRIQKKDYFKNGGSKGCVNCYKATFDNYKNGSVVGKWTVIDENRNRWGERYYLCRCVCGNEHNVTRRDLLRGKSTQCTSCHISELNTTHGKTRTRIYRIWFGIKRRCLSPKEKCYRWYGGRGIKICDRWLIFENFLADMNPCPDGMTIDRIDPDGNYEPSNCRWVTPQENQKNRRCSARHRDKYIYILKEKLCDACKKNLLIEKEQE
jgi:hypothetical protein